MPLEARFDSTCTNCGDVISTGELIERDPRTDAYVHADCAPEGPEALLKPEPAGTTELCPKCGMAAAWPVHGSCGVGQDGNVAPMPDPFAHARGEAVPEPAPAPSRSFDLSDLMPGQAVEVDEEGQEIVAAWVEEGTGQLVTLPARPEPDRDKLGRYRLPLPDGKTIRSHTRVTTMCKKVEDSTLIDAWRERQLAYGLGSEAAEDLYATVASHRDPHGVDRKVYTEVIDKVHEVAGTNRKSRLGTALHRFCEEVDRGRMKLTQVPKRWRDRVAQYQETLVDNGIRIDPDGIETIYIDDRHRVAGMGDRRLFLSDYRLPVIGDLKTGSGVELGASAMTTQLAIYQDHTATYDVATKRRGPRAEMDNRIGIIIHLPQDGDTCQLHQVNLAQGRENYMVALEVRAIQRTKPEQVMVPYVPRLGALQPYEWIATRLMGIVPLLVERSGLDAEAVLYHLAQYWPAEVRMPFPPEPTLAEVEAMDAWLGPLEMELEAPFVPGVVL